MSRALLLLSASCLLVLGCARSESRSSGLDCGNDCLSGRNTINQTNGDTNQAVDLGSAGKAIVHLAIGSSECNGVHVGEGRVLTALHCVSAFAGGGDCSAVTASWTGGKASCVQVKAASDGRDLAEVTVSPAPPAEVSVRSEADVGDSVICASRRANGALLAYTAPVTNSGDFLYTCNFAQGQSGSALLVSSEPLAGAALVSDWVLVGVHQGAAGAANRGVRIPSSMR